MVDGSNIEPHLFDVAGEGPTSAEANWVYPPSRFANDHQRGAMVLCDSCRFLTGGRMVAAKMAVMRRNVTGLYGTVHS